MESRLGGANENRSCQKKSATEVNLLEDRCSGQQSYPSDLLLLAEDTKAEGPSK